MEFTVSIEGTMPLLMHSSRLADPLNPAAKAVKSLTSKRLKTDEDYEEIARLEHAGSLYMDPDIGPYIPGENIFRCLVDGGTITRAGKKVSRGMFIDTDVNPLGYQGPRTVDALWDDENFRHVATVVVGMKRISRCRPIFRQWRCQAHGILDTAVLSLEELSDIAQTAGSLIGLGDWRPRFGRFTATLKEV